MSIGTVRITSFSFQRFRITKMLVLLHKLAITLAYIIPIISLMCIMGISCTPTIFPLEEFDAHEDVVTMCYISRQEPEYYPDYNQLVRMICHRTREQRIQMKKELDVLRTYMSTDCVEDIATQCCNRGEISYCQLVRNTFKTEQEIYLHDLHREFEWYKRTDKGVIVEIFLSIPPLEKAKFREAYDKTYGSLEEDLYQLGDDFQYIALELSERERQPERPVDLELAEREADLLIAGISEWDYNTQELDRILMETPPQQLNATLHAFKRKHEEPLENVICHKMKHKKHKHKRHAYKDMVLYGYNPNTYYARRILHSVKGWGTKDHILNRIISIQCEKNLVEISEEYQLLTGDSLLDTIKGDTTGHQEKLLRCLAGDEY